MSHGTKLSSADHEMMQRLKYANTTGPLAQQFFALIKSHMAALERVGFGTDDNIVGAEAVDAVNEHFEQIEEALESLDRLGLMARQS